LISRQEAVLTQPARATHLNLKIRLVIAIHIHLQQTLFSAP
jgi:hypothetical protein